KFESANRRLGTQMKATGEVMAIGRTFEESLLKAVRSLESGIFHLELPGNSEIEPKVLPKQIERATDERLFFIGEALRQGISIEQIHDWSQIDLYFLYKLERIIKLEQQLRESPMHTEWGRKAKEFGFSDKTMAKLWNIAEKDVYEWRK